MAILSLDAVNGFADAVLPHYLACALWADSPEEADWSDIGFGEEARQLALIDIRFFVLKEWAYIQGVSPSDIGHNLWLTRNGHGTGFWDRDSLSDFLKDRFTATAEFMGNVSLFAEDDEIYFEYC